MPIRYVAPNGSNSTGDGTIGNPWLTINFALSQMTTSDQLIIRGNNGAPHTYYEEVSVPISGTPTQRALITGEVDGSGNRLVTIDNTVAVVGTWVAATDSETTTNPPGFSCSNGSVNLTGTGTYKLALGAEPWVLMEPDGDGLLRIDRGYMGTVKEGNNYCRTGLEHMAIANGATMPTDFNADQWDGIEAMFGYRPATGVTYVRYRGQDNPNTKSLRYSTGNPTISIIGQSHVTISNVNIRGGYTGVLIGPTSSGGGLGNGSAISGIIVERCKILASDYGVEIIGRTASILVRDCINESGLICFQNHLPVSTIKNPVQPYEDERLTTYHEYALFKFMNNKSFSNNCAGVGIFDGFETGGALIRPTLTEVSGCTMRRLNYGVTIEGGDGTDIHHNDIRNCVDMAFQRSNGRNISIHDNFVAEQKYTLLRWHRADEFAGTNYIYRNRVSQPRYVGTHVALYRDGRGETGSSTSNLTLWFYHNSFHGGNTVFEVNQITSFTGLRIVNNILSHSGDVSNSDGFSNLGAFDYNTMTSTLGAGGGWYGGNNVTGMPAIWAVQDGLNLYEQNFTVPAGHSTKASGLDVSEGFTLLGNSYSPLVGTSINDFPGNPDRGWYATISVSQRGHCGQGF